jgi:hypothetical protein
MYRITLLITAFCGTLLCAGCASSQYVPQAQQPTRTPELTEVRASSSQLVDGEAGQLSVEWTLGTAPYRIVWTFSGGVEETVVWDTVSTRKYALPVVWSNPAGDPATEFNCRVEISDIGNAYAMKNFRFTVQPQTISSP